MIKKSLGGLILFLIVCLFLASTSALADAQKKPIHLRMGTIMSVPSLDPKDQTNAPSYVVAGNIYDSLVFPDPEKKYVPWMAESWKTSPDGLKYTFQLRKGILFHDETEVTSEDVVFSMDRMMTMGGAVSTFFKVVKPGTTQALDKYTVEFNLAKRDPAFMAALISFKILNKKLILQNKQPGSFGEYGDYGAKWIQTHDAGSGPFMVLEHKHADFLKTKRFEKYTLTKWHANAPDLVTFSFIPEMVTMATKFQKGELDITDTTLEPTIVREIKKNPDLVVEEHIWPATYLVVMNNKKPPLDDVHVRKAINYAFNKEVIMNQILAGGKYLLGPLPEELRGGCKDLPYYPFDLNKAKEMLKKSKYSPDQLKQFKMEFASVATSERFKKIGLAFASHMQAIGLNVQMKAVRWDDICQTARKPETAHHFALNAQAAKYPHASQFLVFYTPEGWGIGYPLGGIYYENPKVTEAIQKGNNAATAEEQDRFYCEAQKSIVEDAPVAFSNESIFQYPYWRYVKGFKFPMGANYFEHRFDHFWFDTEDPVFRKNQGW